uniref:Chordin-like 2 n=1 Tax=Erpetoichthys calabaricus TaxID=27687 RepID=A0A8C4RXE8_ERPCA
MFCIRCTCSQTGSINCVSIKCPTPPCENPVTETQQCCPKCLEPKTPAGLRAKQKSCHHNGVIYQAGEMFTSNDLFPLRRPNQCVLCSCSNGNIFCGLKTCLTLTCATPVSLPDTCCQFTPWFNFISFIIIILYLVSSECISQAKGKLVKTSHSTVSNTPRGINLKSFMHKGAAGTTMKIVLQEKHKRACTYSGKTYSHGEVWHPVLRPHRILECILCTCKDGIQECKKMACPSEYPCEYPVKIEGKCCKTCPGNGNLTQLHRHNSWVQIKIIDTKILQKAFYNYKHKHNSLLFLFLFQLLQAQALSTSSRLQLTWMRLSGFFYLGPRSTSSARVLPFGSTSRSHRSPTK